jgi:hypothetical protein
LETGWAEWTSNQTGHYSAKVDAASFAAVEEEVDFVDAQALLGAAIHRDALHHKGTRQDDCACARIGELKVDRGAGARRRRTLCEGRQRADAQRGGDGQWTKQTQMYEGGS